MNITYDPAKRDKTIEERDLDFLDAAQVLKGRVFQFEDTRADYGEKRMMCLGLLHGRMVVAGYVQRGETRHIFSMRKANDKEQRRFKNQLE